VSETFLKDSNGASLTRQQVIDRLCQYDVYMIMRNCDEGNYNWLSDIREHGFQGYKNYSDDELIAEWCESEEGYHSMIYHEEQPYEVVGI
jgi:hypothetical protein